MLFFRGIFLVFLLLTTLNGSTKIELEKRYETLKVEYLRAVLSGNKAKEIKHLEELIYTGSKIGVNTTKYKSELSRLKKVAPTKKVEPKKSVKQTKTTPKKSSTKYNIKSVRTSKNSIIIDFTHNIRKKDIKFFEQREKKLYKDIFEINGNFEEAYETKLKIPNVDRVIVIQSKPKVLKITLQNDYNLKTIYIVNRRQIIIKVLDTNIKEKFQVAKIKSSTKKTTPTIAISKDNLNKDRVIVIDPGHGGKDAGAVGKSKKYEKHVVLNVSKYLYKILKDRGYKVYLTRNTDKFIELKNRTKFSNDKKADIFLSIHVNSIGRERAKKMQGIETFFLSPARSERAKRVAAIENKGDMNAMNMNSQMSFLTILNQSKITESNKLAIDIQQNLLYSARKQYKDIIDGGVREGPFWILVGAQMPSILVELGYISHPKESIRLFNSSYQKKLAEGLANGIDAYFAKNPY